MPYFFSFMSILLQQDMDIKKLSSKSYEIYLRKMRLHFAMCCGVSGNNETSECEMSYFSVNFLKRHLKKERRE